jgi:hypothetical protein
MKRHLNYNILLAFIAFVALCPEILAATGFNNAVKMPMCQIMPTIVLKVPIEMPTKCHSKHLGTLDNSEKCQKCY